MTTAPPPIRVTVNDRPLSAIALLDRGRVLVPMRAIFEALHRPLPRTAIAGSRIIAGRTFVPIRFTAQQLGARVFYDGRARLVNVFARLQPLRPAVPAPTASPLPITGLQPAEDARVASAYPTIAASVTLEPDAYIRTFRMLLDGVDVSLMASHEGSYVTYLPRNGLAVGTHQVIIDGTSSYGRPFHVAWQFETTRPPSPDSGNASLPGYYGWSQLQLTAFTNEVIGGDPVQVQLVGPPDGRAYAFLCTSPWQYELWSAPGSPFYNGTLPTDRTYDRLSCPITAMFVSPSGQVTYAPYPAFVTLLPWRHRHDRDRYETPQPSPTPNPTPTPVRYYPQPVATQSPGPRRSPQPPLPRRTPLPPVQRPIPLPRPIVEPHPTVPPRRAPAPAPRETARPTSHPKATPVPKHLREVDPRRTTPPQ